MEDCRISRNMHDSCCMVLVILHSQGVYVYDQISKQGRRLINIVDMSHIVSDSVQQIVQDPVDTEIMWQKVSRGLLCYILLTCVN